MKQLLSISGIILLASLVISSLPAQVFAGEDDIVFIHHSCGNNFLNQGLKTQLLTKDYIDEVNDIYYGDDLQPDDGRPDSLGGTPGDKTNMNHWVMWFNDYLEGIRQFDCSNGSNRIIMFKSCYPISNVSSDGREPGDPFSSSQTLANYKSVFRKYNDADGIYSRSGNEYTALEKVFANNPDILFIAVTAPPRHFGPSDATNDTEAQRARDFNNWLKDEWLASYKASITGSMNVAVFDWFNVLANPSDHATYPNRLKEEYGGNNGDSHPNATGNSESAEFFSTFIDQVFTEWNEITSVQHWSLY